MGKEPGWFSLTFAEKPLHLKVAMHPCSPTLAKQKQDLMQTHMKDVQRERSLPPNQQLQPLTGSGVPDLSLWSRRL